MAEPTIIDAFILTRHWHDTRRGVALEFWCASEGGPVRIDVGGQEAVCFLAETQLQAAHAQLHGVPHRVGTARFKNFTGAPVAPVYFRRYLALREAADHLRTHGIDVWEADVKPPERYLMERFITGALRIAGDAKPHDGFLQFTNPRLQTTDHRPRLKRISLDIETSLDARELYSIAVYSEDPAASTVFMVGGESHLDDTLEVVACDGPADCLQLFLAWLAAFDPDILIGWNLVQFDLWVLEQLCARHQVEFTAGRHRQVPHWREDEDNNRRYLQLPGRVALDGIDLLKAATYSFPSFSLEKVARHFLGEGKMLAGSHRAEEIATLFHRDQLALARYNLKDCQLVWNIFRAARLVEFTIERSQLTGLLLDRAGGSVAAFDYAYLPRLHRKGYTAPNLGELQSKLSSPGGYVLDSRPGIYQNVLVLDFKSLYPSIMRTFFIDPYAFWYAEHNGIAADERVSGFRGASFSRRENILPDILETLWQARDKAKAAQNQPLSQAIKIIMNSFYGVLGSTGCRFYDPRVCSSITLRGHEIMQQSKMWIEQRGHEVIYGDTDSLFVWIGDGYQEAEALSVGQDLAAQLNRHWREQLRRDYGIDSALEMEFETLYLKFLMPTMRNSELGSKKRYAGLVRKQGTLKLVFTGLENVRTDWTDLAKEFQEELYRRVFYTEPVEDYVRQTVAAVREGRRDDELVYRKRLRRKLKDYDKNVPPHVQAARKQQQATGEKLYRGDWIKYVVTLAGPEPVNARQHAIDYQHYIDRQLAPVADGVLHFIGLSFQALTAPQLSLFSDL